MFSRFTKTLLIQAILFSFVIGPSCERGDKKSDEAHPPPQHLAQRQVSAKADSAISPEKRAMIERMRRGQAGDAAKKPGEGAQKTTPSDQMQQRMAQRGDQQRTAHTGDQQPTHQAMGERFKRGEGQAALIPVEVSRISRRDMTDYILASTTLEALRQVEVYAKTSGIVKSLRVEEGDDVSAGDTLVILDDREARLNLRRTEIEFKEAENALKRSREMSAKNLISREEFETSQLAYEKAKTNLDEAKLAYEYTRVTAPIDGRITERLVELGTMVTTGKILFHLADFKPLRARVYIPEKELHRLAIGQKVLLEVDSEPDREFPAVVKLISSVIDPSSGTFKVTVEVRSSEGLLRPGMFASVRIIVDRHESTLAVPAEAILYEGERRYIYTVRDGSAQRVNVVTGFTDSGYVEVFGTIEADGQVVVAGQNNLASGSMVEIVRDASGVKPESTGVRTGVPGSRPDSTGQGS